MADFEDVGGFYSFREEIRVPLVLWVLKSETSKFGMSWNVSVKAGLYDRGTNSCLNVDLQIFNFYQKLIGLNISASRIPHPASQSAT